MEKEARVEPQKWWKLLGDNILEYIQGKAGSHPSAIQGIDFHYHLNDVNTALHFLQPAIIVIINGKKYVRIGNEEFIYSEKSYFLSSIDMPVSSCYVLEDGNRPYLAMSILLNIPLIMEIFPQISSKEKENICSLAGSLVCDIDDELLDCLLRLTILSTNPDSNNYIKKLIIRELHYRLLFGKNGEILQNIAIPKSHSSQIIRVINFIKSNYNKNLSIDSMAAIANMAPSTLFKYFKSLTTLSPLQYLKRLRLSEANRLIQQGDHDVSQASMLVGYRSNSQFIRDYKSLYGTSPYKNIHKKGDTNETDHTQ